VWSETQNYGSSTIIIMEQVGSIENNGAEFGVEVSVSFET
jgi:hypothetical protein